MPKTSHKQDLKISEIKISSLFNNALEGIYQSTIEGKLVLANHAFARMFGFDSPDEAIEILTNVKRQLYVNPVERDKVKQLIEEQGSVSGYETQFYRKDGSKIWVSFSMRKVRGANGSAQYYEGVIEEITSRKLMEQELDKIRIRQNALLELYRMEDINYDTITGFVAEECVKLTESEFAFIGFVDENDAVMHTHLWSNRAMEQCSVDGKPVEFPLKNAGLWAEAIRQKKPVIVDDYSKAHPYKKGCPAGHVRIKRFVGIPLVQKNRVVLVGGFANKEDCYTDSDIINVTLMLEGMWNHVQRKKAEEEVQNSEERYRKIFDNTGTAMLVVEEDTTISLVNNELLNITGYKREEFKNKISWTEFVAKEDLERMKGYHELRRASPDMAPNSYEFKLIDRNGQAHNMFLTISMIPSTKKSIISLQDLTQLREAQKKIIQGEQKYRSIFENAVEGIFQTTPEGRYISANPALAKMFGYDSPEQVINEIDDLSKQGYVNPEDRERYKKDIEERGVVIGFETQHYKKDGSVIWTLINARSLKDESGKVLYYEGTIEDITSRKQAEESLKQTLEKLRKSLAGTIQAVSLTVETKDPYTAGHQRRVANLARAIAQEMDLPSDTVDNIRMAGNVHDIGKISVPAEILAKPTRLTHIEMSLIKVHPQTGHDILKDAELPCLVSEMVLQHHERLDGSGYPQGLKSNQILLEAKILAVADVVEAIATHRPYRPALGIDFALGEIEKNKGILYDEKVVEVCINLFREKTFAFE